MSGKRYLLDTNAIIVILQGNNHLLKLLQNADWIGISIISQIEFLSFPSLNSVDRQSFTLFINRIEVISLETNQIVLIDKIIEVRQKYRLKLPDAIIGATAIYMKADLLTQDQEINKITELTIINW